MINSRTYRSLLFLFAISFILIVGKALGEKKSAIIKYFYLCDKNIFSVPVIKGKLSDDNSTEISTAGMTCRDIRVADQVLLMELVPENGSEIILGIYDHDSQKTLFYNPGFDLTKPHDVTFTAFNMNAYFFFYNESDYTQIIRYDFIKKESKEIARLKGKTIRPAISPDSSTLAFFIQKNPNGQQKRPHLRELFLYVFDIKKKKLKKVDSKFVIPRGIQKNQGISWAPDGKTIMINASCVTTINSLKIKGQFTTVNASDLSTHSFETGYFGGWIDNNSFVATHMPDYKIKIVNIQGKSVKEFDTRGVCFVLPGSSLLIVRPVGNPSNLVKRFLWDIDGNTVGSLSDGLPLPWEIWKYSFSYFKKIKK